MTPATELAFERMEAAIELSLQDADTPYPSKVAFAGADMDNLGDILARYARELRPVVLVYPDGQERLLHPEMIEQAG